MINGKTCNAVTNNASAQKCYPCGLIGKTFNKIDLALNTKIIDDTGYQFGLSYLREWIRFFEYFICHYAHCICNSKTAG